VDSVKIVDAPQYARVFPTLDIARRAIAYLDPENETDAAAYPCSSGYFIQATDPQSGQRLPLSIDGFLEPLPLS